ncbi:hypothetical protein HY498_01530 [Candidatus Woesearchaeota archaeon]|nr:hypothetical protein [Candidatus Woesearchaeota archaeon]
MVNKKGFLRTIESLISVILILIVLLIIVPKEVPEKKEPEIINSAHSYILNTILYSEDHRKCILGETPQECKYFNCGIGKSDIIVQTLDTAKAPGFTTECIVCKTTPRDRSCTFPKVLPNTDIYVDDVLLTQGNEERIIRLFSYAQ